MRKVKGKKSLPQKILDLINAGPISSPDLCHILGPDLEGVQPKNRRQAIWAALSRLEARNLIERDPLQLLESLEIKKDGEEKTVLREVRVWRRKGARMV